MSDSYGSNSYLVVDKKTALIDAGIDSSRIAEKIEELGVGLDFLINTHCHFDHIGGNRLLKERFGPKIAMHEIDADAIRKNKKATLYEMIDACVPLTLVDIRLSGGDILNLGKTRLEVIHTPGHTMGSICLYEPGSRSLFSGDTVFSGGVGRADMGGDWEELGQSIRALVKLTEERGIETIYPGHGPADCGDSIEETYNTYFG